MPDIGGIPAYPSTLTGPELDKALRNIGQVQDAVERTEAAAQTAEQYGQIVEQNQTAIQAIEDNLADVQGAAQNAVDAKNAATSAAASASAASQSAADAEDAAQRAEAAAGIDPNDYFTKPQTKSLVSWQYTCTYDLDNWVASSSTDKANGYPYTQTVTLTPLDPQAPAITADSVFEPQIGCDGTGVAETDNALRAALAIIANGNSESGVGTITTIVQKQPEVDVPVIWTLKTEVQ